MSCGTLYRTIRPSSPGSTRKIAHSTQFSGKGYHRSAKPSGGEDLDIEEPVACWYAPAFHLHSTLPSIWTDPCDGCLLSKRDLLQARETQGTQAFAPFLHASGVGSMPLTDTGSPQWWRRCHSVQRRNTLDTWWARRRERCPPDMSLRRRSSPSYGSCARPCRCSSPWCYWRGHNCHSGR